VPIAELLLESYQFEVSGRVFAVDERDDVGACWAAFPIGFVPLGAAPA